MFGSYEGTIYPRTAAFYVTKILRCVKELLSIESWPSDNIPIKICRKNLGKIWLFCSIYFSFWIKMLKNVFKAIGGGPGSFLQVKLRWKFQSQGCQRFLRNEDILPYEKIIAIWIFGPPYFPIVKFHEKWPLKSAIWSYKIKIICLGGLKLHKKVKSNSLSQI